MKVRVKNTEPCWVEYMFEVEIPDNTPDAEILDAALERIDGNYGNDVVAIDWGPEIRGKIKGMDQEWEVWE